MAFRFIDISHLLAWGKSQYTGISRFESEIAKRYMGRPNVRFCAFSDAAHQYVEVDLTEVLATNAVVKTARLAQGLRQRVSRKIEARTHAKRLQGYLRALGAIEFAEGDVLIDLGALWDRRSSIDYLRTVKAAKEISVAMFIQDLIPISHPQWFGDGFPNKFERGVKATLEIADFVGMSSKSTLADLGAFANANGMSLPAAAVIALGDDSTAGIAKPPVGFNENLPFLLCVSTFEIRKNHQLIAAAYKLAHDSGVVLPRIVLVGAQGWLTENLERSIVTDTSLAKSTVRIRNASDVELRWLYEHCLFTVYPSFYEGYGLPIAESLGHGKFCLSSNTSSMPEVGREFVEYFSPDDAPRLLELLLKYSDSPQLLSEREAIIQRDYKRHSWDDTFTDLDAAITEALPRN